MTTTERAAVAGFAITVPQDWYELELDPQRRDAAIRAQVADRSDGSDPDPRRSALVDFLLDQAGQAWDSGAVYSASLVELTDDGPVTATVTVSVVLGPPTADPDDPDRLSDLVEPLQEKVAGPGDDTWIRVTVVDLPGPGPAARAYGVEDLDLPDQAGRLRIVSMQTMVPIPGLNRVVLITCTSPLVSLAEPLFELFDLISATFELTTVQLSDAEVGNGSAH